MPSYLPPHDPSLESQTEYDREQQKRKELTQLVMPLLWVMGVGASLYILGMCIWLTLSVTVTSDDLSQASWLLRPHGLSGFPFNVWGVPWLLLGAGVAVWWWSGPVKWKVLATLMALALTWSTTPTLQFKFAALQNVAKIGCYVPTTVECQNLLGVPVTNTLNVDSEEYLATLPNYISAGQQLKRTLLAFPLLTVAAAIIEVPNVNKLNATLERQREVVREYILKATPAS